MPQQMRIHGALRESKAQPRHQNIFELFPDEDSIGFADFHCCDPVVVGAALRRHLRFADTRLRAFSVPVGLRVALGFSPASSLFFASRRVCT